jgi:hypothetical protein
MRNGTTPKASVARTVSVVYLLSFVLVCIAFVYVVTFKEDELISHSGKSVPIRKEQAALTPSTYQRPKGYHPSLTSTRTLKKKKTSKTYEHVSNGEKIYKKAAKNKKTTNGGNSFPPNGKDITSNSKKTTTNGGKSFPPDGKQIKSNRFSKYIKKLKGQMMNKSITSQPLISNENQTQDPDLGGLPSLEDYDVALKEPKATSKLPTSSEEEKLTTDAPSTSQIPLNESQTQNPGLGDYYDVAFQEPNATAKIPTSSEEEELTTNAPSTFSSSSSDLPTLDYYDATSNIPTPSEGEKLITNGPSASPSSSKVLLSSPIPILKEDQDEIETSPVSTNETIVISLGKNSMSSSSLFPSPLPSIADRSPSWMPTSVSSNPPTETSSSRPSRMSMSLSSSVRSPHPSPQPSVAPLKAPTLRPSWMTISVLPSSFPSYSPSSQPSVVPTKAPTLGLSLMPTSMPSSVPSPRPSPQPSVAPTNSPSLRPSRVPTSMPSSVPSPRPSPQPSVTPTKAPTLGLSLMPTGLPSSVPSPRPSPQPSVTPTNAPSLRSSRMPTSMPSSVPSPHPSSQPSVAPTNSPSLRPSRIPSSGPSFRPTLPTTLYPGGIQPSARLEMLTEIALQVSGGTINPGSPQEEALEWLLESDAYIVCPDDETVAQRYILSVLYFSTGGHEWIECNAHGIFSGNFQAFDMNFNKSIEFANTNCDIETSPIRGGKRNPLFLNTTEGSNAWLTPVHECEWAGIVCRVETMKVDRIEFGKLLFHFVLYFGCSY